jgi:amino acid adenylation domain-containing protein
MTANPPLRATADSPIYVIYTSGSTGQPKGVVVTHRSVCNYLLWVSNQLFAEPVNVIPLTTSLAFDAVLKQLFAPLLTGRTVHVISQDDRQQPARLLQHLCAKPKTAFNGVPALWQAILAVIESAGIDVPLENLTHLFLGGQALTQSLVQRTFAALPHVQIWNLYGPTETTANSTSTRLIPGQPISIGRPLANTQVYVLDRNANPVPIGVPGELHIGGDGVAQGYLNRPELTADKFVTNHFSNNTAARLYRTGDLCRWRADGNLEFLGRIDDQEKLRGFRIELREIETVLNEHPSIAQSVVLLREGRPGDQRLVAYCVLAADSELDFSALRSHLRVKLPNYMIPTALVRLDSLPLTPNGKIDRHALPPPQPESFSGHVAPRTSLERTLTSICAALLGIEQVGVLDNFFDLGGHSLLCMELIARVEKETGLRLKPAEFMFQTLGQVAANYEHELPIRKPSQPPAKTRTVFSPLKSLVAGRGVGTLPLRLVWWLRDTVARSLPKR